MVMQIHYSISLAAISVIVAVLASYVALNFAHSVSHAKGRAQLGWLACGAIAMGIGIWSMHFIGMLAFEMPGMEMSYDIPLMSLSVIVAVGASALALFIVSRQMVPASSIVAGGIAMAAAIAGMHYIGMYSMRMPARIEWNIYFVFLSIAIALFASFGSLLISLRLRDKPDRFWTLAFSSLLMGIAIAGMHYTGMVAATFIHDPSIAVYDTNLFVSSNLSITVVAATLFILAIALMGSISQRLVRTWTREAEENLTTSEEKFRALVEAVEDYAIIMLDANGLITTWNSGAEKITGYRHEEAIGREVSLLWPPNEGRETAIDELGLAAATGRFKTDAIRMKKDGTQFWANITIHPLYDSKGGISGYSKVIRDITQQKSLNEQLENRVRMRTLELAEREAQLRTITNALPILVAQLDRDQRFTFVNESCADWFGLDRSRLREITLEEALGGERYLENRSFVDRVLAGEIVSFERYSVSGERAVNFGITFVPEFDENQVVKGFILVGTDVTKYKEIENELKAAKEAAEVANETKSAFLANMSHEIRTPLGAVLGFSELLLSQDLTAAERAGGIEIIKRNGRLLSNIINDILDLSKVEAGKLEIESVDVSFAELLAELGSLLNLEATEKGVQLTVKAEGLVPTRIKTDPLRLRQILLNIIGNAIKFTEKGSVDVRVKTLFEGVSPKLAFFVKDTGEGIKPEQARRLFTPFTQADVSTTRRFGGTGLGLVLSKKLANALGGDLTLIKSELGVGSTFCITIDPGVSEAVLFESRSSSGANPKVTSLSLHSEPIKKLNDFSILLVDDSSDNQALIQKILTMAGARVETASNGREGFEKAIDGDFDVVLMDLQMPEMDGYEATRQLRVNGFDRPIIALTAHAMKEERKKCLENGFTDHVTKPVDRQTLIEALSQFEARKKRTVFQI